MVLSSSGHLCFSTLIPPATGRSVRHRCLVPKGEWLGSAGDLRTTVAHVEHRVGGLNKVFVRFPEFNKQQFATVRSSTDVNRLQEGSHTRPAAADHSVWLPLQTCTKNVHK